MSEDNLQIVRAGDDKAGARRRVNFRTSSTPMGFDTRVLTGKDIMLGDLYSRVIKREYNNPLADMDWLESRLLELGNHSVDATYDGVYINPETKRKQKQRISVDMVREEIVTRLDVINKEMAPYLIPAANLEGVRKTLQNPDREISDSEICETLERTLQFLQSEGAPDNYYGARVYNNNLGDYSRPVYSKERLIKAASDMINILSARNEEEPGQE